MPPRGDTYDKNAGDGEPSSGGTCIDHDSKNKNAIQNDDEHGKNDADEYHERQSDEEKEEGDDDDDMRSGQDDDDDDDDMRSVQGDGDDMRSGHMQSGHSDGDDDGDDVQSSHMQSGHSDDDDDDDAQNEDAGEGGDVSLYIERDCGYTHKVIAVDELAFEEYEEYPDENQ